MCYERPVYQGYTRNQPGLVAICQRTEKHQNRERSLRRARTNIRRLINANCWQYRDKRGRTVPPVFLTLTFAENILNLNDAHRYFRCFIKRLNYTVYGKQSGLAYIAVPDFQQRGSVHYHTVYFNLPYIEVGEVESLWGMGFVKLNAIRDVNNLGAYIARYLRSDFIDPRLNGRRYYFCSHGLLRPKVIVGNNKASYNQIDDIISTLKLNVVYENKFFSDKFGAITYKQYETSTGVITPILNKGQEKNVMQVITQGCPFKSSPV